MPSSRNSTGSTTPIGRNSSFPSSSACAGTARIRSCASSRAGYSTTQRPRRKRRLPKSFAALRLDQKVDASDKLKVHGRLSTHVLDTHAGHPAAGVAIKLLEIAAHGEPRVITNVTTNLDGRSDQPLIGGRPIPIGRYELRFHVGDYFTRRGGPDSGPPFIHGVPGAFGVA